MMTKTKHLVNTTMHKMVCKTNYIVRTSWFKWAALGVGVWLIFSKNISFQISVGETLTTTIENQQPDRPPKVVQTTLTLDNLKASKQRTQDESPPNKSTPNIPDKTNDNRANDFSNIAFVMNPAYAKRHNISPEIVAKKNAIVRAYVSRYVPIAKIEQNLYGIPASITLAQGLLESDAGHSRLAKQNNNHFGIKCFSRTCAKGHCKNYTDDSHKDFFRIYKNAWESYRSHSLFLQKPRYKHLLDLPSTDYKAWAKGLSKAGYATDKGYADKLITLIETLELHQYDK